jgi:hypothetical protein
MKVSPHDEAVIKMHLNELKELARVEHLETEVSPELQSGSLSAIIG